MYIIGCTMLCKCKCAVGLVVVPRDDDTRCPQQAVAKITHSQIDGHQLMRSELLSPLTINQQY